MLRRKATRGGYRFYLRQDIFQFYNRSALPWKSRASKDASLNWCSCSANDVNSCPHRLRTEAFLARTIQDRRRHIPEPFDRDRARLYAVHRLVARHVDTPRSTGVRQVDKDVPARGW